MKHQFPHPAVDYCEDPETKGMVYLDIQDFRKAGQPGGGGAFSPIFTPDGFFKGWGQS
tara:strand:+ start:12251 stop:12424 length:174 start_codon:yes stop_codon:yes gene_type:complete